MSRFFSFASWVGIVFMTSGRKHLQDPEARSKDIGMSKGFTIFLGATEFAPRNFVCFPIMKMLPRFLQVFPFPPTRARKWVPLLIHGLSIRSS
jgi:hypothetical protein